MPGNLYSKLHAQSGVKICIHVHVLLLTYNPAWETSIPKCPREYLPTPSQVQKSTLHNDELSCCLCGPSIPPCPQVFLIPVHALYTPLKQITGVLQRTTVPGKDSRTGRNSALASKSCIFVLYLQLLRHIYISICTPVFIKT